MHKTVAIIGGGLAGLGSAIRLAKMGFSVKLFEQNFTVGGKLQEYQHNGFRFDTGPSILTMPAVVDELIEFAGFNRKEMLKLIPVQPLCRYFYPDGTQFDAMSDIQQMVNEIGKVFPGQEKRFLKFIQYAEKIYVATADAFLFNSPHDIKRLLKTEYFQLLFKFWQIDPLRTVHDSISNFFSDPKLIQLFDRYATYTGSNPFQAPATLNIIPYVEIGLGGYYVKGGMYRLVEVLSNIAKDLGVEVITNAKVNEILLKDNTAKGIRVNDEQILTDYVLSTADVVSTFNNLISGNHLRREKYNRFEPSLSGLVYLWNVKRKNPELAHHNIFFSDDYKSEFNSIFDELKAPTDPTVYISITSKNDTKHAPENGENWFVLLNMPYLVDGQNWELETDRMRTAIFTRLEKAGIDVEHDILHEHTLTPLDFQFRDGSNRGSIYGISSNSRKYAFTRPANRDRKIKNLYFAGGSVHPGGGIPLVLLSGKIAAELIAENEDKHYTKLKR